MCGSFATSTNVLLIADEVAVGFGRTGRMFACEHENVAPDFLCLAKGITGGYMPLAATLATDEIWHAFLGTYAESKTFFHGHTYGGNPLGAAVALANLQIFEEERTLEQIQPKIARLAEHLARISQHAHVGDVRQRGLIAGVELVRDKVDERTVSLGRTPRLARLPNRRWPTACLFDRWAMLWSSCRRWRFDSTNSIEFAPPSNVESRKRHVD